MELLYRCPMLNTPVNTRACANFSDATLAGYLFNEPCEVTTALELSTTAREVVGTVVTFPREGGRQVLAIANDW
jgi:hypothetical protein